jgi:hypothetical protein
VAEKAHGRRRRPDAARAFRPRIVAECERIEPERRLPQDLAQRPRPSGTVNWTNDTVAWTTVRLPKETVQGS